MSAQMHQTVARLYHARICNGSCTYSWCTSTKTMLRHVVVCQGCPNVVCKTVNAALFHQKTAKGCFFCEQIKVKVSAALAAEAPAPKAPAPKAPAAEAPAPKAQAPKAARCRIPLCGCQKLEADQQPGSKKRGVEQPEQQPGSKKREVVVPSDAEIVAAESLLCL